MKILLINKFHYYKGGSETYYFGLADLLRKHGHQVIFFSMKDERNVPCDQEKYFVENVDYNGKMTKIQMVHEGLKMLYSFESKKKLEQLIEDEKPDVAHLNIFQTQLTASVVDVLYKHHIPMVYTMHDLKALCPCYTMLTHGEVCERCMHGNFLPCISHKCMKDSLAKSVLAAMEAYVYRICRTYRKIDLVITPSGFYKRKMLEGRVTRAKVIHMSNFLPANSGPKEELGQAVRPGEYFLYFGRLSREKGLVTLVEAYQKANLLREMYIVGTGPMEAELKEKIKNLQLDNHVKMLGFKHGQELTDIVQNCRCVILPSEWYENGPYSILEAMEAARPVIVSQNGGLPEIVEEGKNGYISAPCDPTSLAEKMKRMDVASDIALVKMGTASLKKVQEVSDAEKYVRRIEKIYKTLIERKAKQL